MRLIIRDSTATASLYAAQFILHRITSYAPAADRPFVLGLPTGSSPEHIYAHLVAFHRAGKLSFRHVVTFNMDEYVGLPRDHPQSYHSFMYKHLFAHVDILPENVHILNGMAADLDAECARYEEEITKFGGIELFLAGVGEDGHIAFNEPGSSLCSRTRVKTLASDTIAANARFFGGKLDQVPKMALTVGVGTVTDSREVVLIATGAKKAHAIKTGIEEGISHWATVSALQSHPNALVVCDEAATGELKVSTVKYFKQIEEVAGSLGMQHALRQPYSKRLAEYGISGTLPGSKL